MNPDEDDLYQIHKAQAHRRQQAPLPYEQFRSRVPGAGDTDLSGLLAPTNGVSLRIQVQRLPKFEPGRVCITAAAAAVLAPADILRAISRHVAGDWGRLDEHDRQVNERALLTRGQLMSVYNASDGADFWVITDPQWQTTNVEFNICG
jgi:hypothetical protein